MNGRRRKRVACSEPARKPEPQVPLSLRERAGVRGIAGKLPAGSSPSPLHRIRARRFADGLLAAMLGLLALAGHAAAAEPGGDPERSAAALMTPATNKAIRSRPGLAGHSAARRRLVGTGHVCRNVGRYRPAGMALMAGGSTPGRGPYGRQVSRCVEYLLANAQQSGFIIVPRGASHGPMYGHGFATLFLAECYGMSPRPELRETLAKAVQLIVNTQNKRGRLALPSAAHDDADISVTICEMMALRAARNAGSRAQGDGRSLRSSTSRAARTPTAASATCFRAAARACSPARRPGLWPSTAPASTTGPEVRKGLDYLMQFLPRPGVIRARDVLRIRPLLCRPGDVAGRRPNAGPAGTRPSATNRRPAARRRLLALLRQQRGLGGHVPHGPGPAQQPAAHLPTLKRGARTADMPSAAMSVRRPGRLPIGHWPLAFCIVPLACGVSAPAAPPPAVTIDAGRFPAAVAAIDARQQITFRTDQTTRTLAAADLVCWGDSPPSLRARQSRGLHGSGAGCARTICLRGRVVPLQA